MLYIIMCGGEYVKWKEPRQLVEINGERLVERTIRLLRENDIRNIAISSNDPRFNDIGVPVLRHKNEYVARGNRIIGGHWCEAFYPTDEPTCYIFGDVVFSPDAIKTIVETDTDDIEFFASCPPFAYAYPKKWAEPFALKVNDTDHLKKAIKSTILFEEKGFFHRKPIMWELWQVIKRTPLNQIRADYTAINDYTCDIDSKEDIEYFKGNLAL